MGKHWVQAKRAITRHSLEGGYLTFQPGDWFECRNQELLELTQAGLVRTTADVLRVEFVGGDAGVLALPGAVPPSTLGAYGLAMQKGDVLALPWKRTLIMDKGVGCTAETVALGMMRLAPDSYPAWEMVAKLASFTRTLASVGTEDEKARTLEALGDLRLPVYDTRLLWVRRTPATEEVIRLWRAEVEQGHDPQHAFLRVVYRNPVALNTLPADWVGSWIQA
jgi:hypothetical protein